MKLIFVSLFCVLWNAAYGQSEKADSLRPMLSVTGYFLYQSIWTERGNLQLFTRNHPLTAQVDIGVVRTNQKAWNYCNCYSNNGVSLGYTSFANRDQLGRAITVSVFTEPYLFNSKRFQISLRGSAGFAYLNKVYDSIANKQPIFFSEKVSFLLSLGTSLSYSLTDHVKIKATAQFNHISNGGRKDPNEGMNFPGYGVALTYIPQPRALNRQPKAPFADRHWSVMTHVFGNIRTAFADLNWPEEKRIVLGVNVGVIRRITRLNGIGAGGEIYYDGINAVYQQRSGRQLQTLVAGVSTQHYLFFGKLLFGQQMVWYVSPDTGTDKKSFQRYLLEYEVSPHWYAGVTLKATTDHSDFIALSLGRIIRL